MKFEYIDKAQKAKALPKYVICGIDPEDNRLVFLKQVDSNESGDAVNWCIPLFETAEEAQKVLSESNLPKHYNVISQDDMAKLVFNFMDIGERF
ncbi:hypothetical protein BO117_RS13690 [Escherichia coli]|nr:hypothetical protein [Escherichia coli]